MDNFINSIRSKMNSMTEEARRQDADNDRDTPGNVVVTDTPNIYEQYARMAEQENEERRRKEEEMARTMAKFNQDEILDNDEITRLSASGIETKPAIVPPTSVQEAVTEAVKDAIQDQATRLLDQAGMSVLQKPSLTDRPARPPSAPKREEKTFDDDRFGSTFLD